jgi:hypothetical protein
VPNRTLAPLAETTVDVSVKLMPAAATVISAKSIIQPRIVCSSKYGDTETYGLPHLDISTYSTRKYSLFFRLSG